MEKNEQENHEQPHPDQTLEHPQSESTAQMKAFNWLTDHFSNRGKALSLYKRGMTKAKKHDHRGAIDDYTTTIGVPDTPANVKAIVLYNRDLVYVATGEFRKGADDLDAVMAMDEAPASVKTRARQKACQKGNPITQEQRLETLSVSQNPRRETCSF